MLSTHILNIWLRETEVQRCKFEYEFGGRNPEGELIYHVRFGQSKALDVMPDCHKIYAFLSYTPVAYNQLYYVNSCDQSCQVLNEHGLYQNLVLENTPDGWLIDCNLILVNPIGESYYMSANWKREGF